MLGKKSDLSKKLQERAAQQWKQNWGAEMKAADEAAKRYNEELAARAKR